MALSCFYSAFYTLSRQSGLARKSNHPLKWLSCSRRFSAVSEAQKVPSRLRTEKDLTRDTCLLLLKHKQNQDPTGFLSAAKGPTSFAEAAACIDLAQNDPQVAEFIFEKFTQEKDYLEWKERIRLHHGSKERDFILYYKRLYWALLRIYSAKGDLKKLKWILDKMDEREIPFSQQSCVYDALLTTQLYSSFPMHVKLFRFSTNRILRKMAADVELYRILMLACIKNEHPMVAVRLLKEMLENNVKPDQTVFHLVIEALLLSKQASIVHQFLSVFQQWGFQLDNVCYSHLLNYYYEEKDQVNAAKYVDQVESQLNQPGFETGVILFDNYIKCCGLLKRVSAAEKAMHHLLSLGEPLEIISAHTMVLSMFHCGYPQKAFEWFYFFTSYLPPKIQSRFHIHLPTPYTHPMKPDVPLLGALIDGTGRAGQVDAALDWLECMIEKYRLEPNIIVATSLITIFYCHNRLTEGLQLFFHLSEKYRLELDEKAYNSLMTALASHGAPHALFQVLKEMMTKNIVPTSSTFVRLLKTVVSKGNVKVLLELYPIIKSFPVEPDLPLYSHVLKALMTHPTQQAGPDAELIQQQLQDQLKQVYQEWVAYLQSHPTDMRAQQPLVSHVFESMMNYYAGRHQMYRAVKLYFDSLECQLVPNEHTLVRLVWLVGGAARKRGWLQVIRLVRKSSTRLHRIFHTDIAHISYEAWASRLPKSAESDLHRITLGCLVGSFYRSGALNRVCFEKYLTKAQQDDRFQFLLYTLTLSSDTHLFHLHPHLFTRQGVELLWESVLDLYLAQPHHIVPNGYLKRTSSLSDVESRNTVLTRRKMIVFTMALVRHCQVNDFLDIPPRLMEQLQQATGYVWQDVQYQHCIRRLVPYSL